MKVTRAGIPDAVVIADAAETDGWLEYPFTVTASGDNTIVPAVVGKRIRLRRLSPTMSDPDGTSNPLLKLQFDATGGTNFDEIMRGYVISGRFKRACLTTNTPLVLNLSKAGTVSGTAFVELL